MSERQESSSIGAATGDSQLSILQNQGIYASSL